MKSEKISIIIPCYNDAEFIMQSVQSALDQTYENKEIIVVDDGSNEETKAVLKRLELKITLLITQENKGTSAARNAGIAAATGEYILVLDSDDYFESSFCEKAIQVFINKPDVKIVTCYANWFNNTSHQIFKPHGGGIENILLNNVAMGSSMFKKTEWETVYGYDEKMIKGFEDWEFYLKLLKSDGKAEVIPEVLFNYRNKKNSRNKTANLAKYQLLEYIYIKHADAYKEHFHFFIHEWLKSIRKSDDLKQQVMNSLDYKIGNKLLKPFRFMGFFTKKSIS
jgi:hypothetical protein